MQARFATKLSAELAFSSKGLTGENFASKLTHVVIARICFLTGCSQRLHLSLAASLPLYLILTPGRCFLHSKQVGGKKVAAAKERKRQPDRSHGLVYPIIFYHFFLFSIYWKQATRYSQYSRGGSYTKTGISRWGNHQKPCHKLPTTGIMVIMTTTAATTTMTIVVSTLLNTNYLPAWCHKLYILFS